jgi:tRNA dimethylallyltransferase
VLIAGPTASGKSALAMALADLTPATIINADSMQVYADLRIITARPSVADAQRHQHALFGTHDGAQACSAAQWATDASAAIALARQAGRLPILVGGSGLYIRSLIDGIAPVPAIDPAIRAAVRALPVAVAHAALREADPALAHQLNAADTTRVARALEVVRATGHSLRWWQAQAAHGIGQDVRIVPCILTPDQARLEPRIAARLDRMIDEGAGEVERLIARTLDPLLPVMRAIGVREIAAYQAGTLPRPHARAAMLIATRQYAKRQRTWFARQTPPDWRRLSESFNSLNISDLAIILAKQALT